MRRVRDGTWIIFFILGVLGVATAPILLSGRVPNPPSPETTTGLTFDQIVARVPGIDTYVASISRQLGNFMLVSGVLMALVAAVPFRRGERWAWFGLWTVPLLLLIQFVDSNFGRGWWLDLGLLPVTIAGLLLPYRKFFPKRPAT
jgi:membrane protein insertase Oxa1/YidC/SpoIIIJ